MLSEIRLENYKSIKKLDKLKLNPITLISGENSSGKSSILQSILILKQTLESSFSKEPLLLNGEYVSVGEFKDVLFVGAKEDNHVIKIGFDIKNSQYKIKDNDLTFPLFDEDTFDDLSFNIELKEANKKDEETLGKVPILLSSNFKVDKKKSLKIEYDEDLLKKLKTDYDFTEKLNNELFHSGDVYSLTKKDKGNLIKGVKLDKFFPQSIITVDKSKYNDNIYSKMSEVLDFIGSLFKIRASALSNNKNRTEDHFLYRTLDKIRKLTRKIERKIEREIERDRKTEVEQNDNSKLLKGTLEEAKFIFNDFTDSELLKEILEEAKFIFNDFENKEIKNYLLENFKVLLMKLDQINLKKVIKILKECSEGIHELKKSRHNLTLSALTSPKSLYAFEKKHILGLNTEEIQSKILNEFKNVFYLGPLRDEPRVFYRRTGSSNPMYVGQKGENLAFVLKYYSGKVIRTVIPVGEGDDVKYSIEDATLQTALLKWINYLGIAKDIKVEELGNVGLTLRTNIHGNKESDLMNVGVGVSQVLPIIVLGLASPENATLLLEQPELHLHPYIQSKLGDFFLALSQLGKQVIAETHSEYLINRMRFHVASQSLNSEDDLSIYFMERSEENDCSEILKIKIDKYGAIDEYPEGFFDETEKQLENIMNMAFDNFSEGGI